MPQLFKRPSAKKRVALIGAAAIGIFGLGAFFAFSDYGSPEDRARRHYERGLKLVGQHDNAKAVIEFRNALKLKSDMLPAWRSLAQIGEGTQQWGSLIQSLQSIVVLILVTLTREPNSPNCLQLLVATTKLSN